MSAAQRYLTVFFVILIPTLAGLIITAIKIEPLDGPLTRMGGYAERDFGWSGQQQTLGIDDVSVPAYRDYADVLVIGDSFSKPGLWQAYLTRNTGLSVQTLDLGKTSFSGLLQTAVFVKNPPKIVVVESVEVFFLTKFRQSNTACKTDQEQAVFSPALEIKPKSVPFQTKERQKTISLDNLNLNYAWVYWKKALTSRLSEQDNSPVAHFQLTRKDLFSNRLSDQLLVYKPDLDKSFWQNQDIAAATCQLRDLQREFQANRKTVFVFVLVPDKLTAYTTFIADKVDLPRLELNNQLLQRGIQAPDLYRDIAQAIAKSEQDIYLPNETHYGSRGHEIMALSLQHYLQKLGVLKQPAKI
ncbi:MAG: hypothetical protein IPN42_15865 [Methylococcaceae bacterium]|nr:hypothetical protein [Methylococcaceae bacterium]